MNISLDSKDIPVYLLLTSASVLKILGGETKITLIYFSFLSLPTSNKYFEFFSLEEYVIIRLLRIFFLREYNETKKEAFGKLFLLLLID